MRRPARAAIIGVLLLAATTARAHVGIDVMEHDSQEAVANHPDDAAARLVLAKVYHSAQRWDDALVAYDEAAALGADRDECDGGRGQVLLAAGFPKLAKRVFDQILKRRPDAAGIRFDRGRAWIALGEPAQAADDFGQAIAALPHVTPEQVLVHRDALQAAGRAADALHALDTGMARLGPVASLQLAAVDMEVDQHHWDGALGRMEQLLRQAPNNETWIARRGDLLDRLGRHDDARAAYAHALQLIAARPATRRPPAIAALEEKLRAATTTAQPTTTKTKGDR